eukprot:CFRG3915T1
MLRTALYLAVIVFIPYIVIAAQASVIPEIFLQHFGEELAMTITTYSAGMKSLLSFLSGPLVGIASDIYGRKIVVLFGFGVLTLPLLYLLGLMISIFKSYQIRRLASPQQLNVMKRTFVVPSCEPKAFNPKDHIAGESKSKTQRMPSLNPLAALPLVLRNGKAANYLLVLFVMTIVQGAIFQTMVLYCTQYLGLNVVQNGLCMMIWGAILFVSSLLTGRFQMALGSGWALTASCLGTSYVALIMGVVTVSSAPIWASFGFVFGGQIHAACTDGIAVQFSPKNQGQVQGVAAGVKFLGEGIGPPLVGYMMNEWGGGGHASRAYLVLAILSLGITIWAACFNNMYLSSLPSPHSIADDSKDSLLNESIRPVPSNQTTLKNEYSPLIP